MKSNKQKKKLLVAKRKEEKSREFQEAVRKGSILPVDTSKIVSKSVLPTIPRHYKDKEFKCKDCGEVQLWTAKRQKWWYEEAGGEIETAV